MDTRLFKCEYDVRDYFINAYKMTNTFIRDKIFSEGIYIDAKLRREILTGDNSGKITIGGIVKEYDFEDLGGGVYKCRVKPIWR